MSTLLSQKLKFPTIKGLGDLAVSDIECNGFLYNLTAFHCAVILEPFTLKKYRYGPDQLQEYADHLSSYGVWVNHNVRGFDKLALEKLCGYSPPSQYQFDTLVLSRLVNPERKNGHSLESWGYELGYHKGDFGKVNGFDTYQPAMLDYCDDDTMLDALVFLFQIIRLGWYDLFGITEARAKELFKQIKQKQVEVVHG
jgi:hypothetical protein